MGDQTVFSAGVPTRRGQNTKGTPGVVSNGSRIRVYPNQFMMLVDGGRVVDYTAEEGYYTVNNSMAPSLFNGQFGEALKESFDRIRFGGQTYGEQRVYYINLQEIKGLKFGTRTPVNYFDSFYNAELFLRAHGTYSVKITDPINQMSADGIRISFVASKGRELGRYMANVLDEEWNQLRGMEIQAVGIGSISYDEESQKLINLRNRGAMLSDPSIREGYVQGQIAEGLNAAGSNPNGSLAGFMGMGIGMQSGGSFMGAASAANTRQMEMMNQGRNGMYGQNAGNFQGGMPGAGPNAGGGQNGPAGQTWTCACGSVNTGKFCPECGSPRPAPAAWTCACGAVNTGKFCSECGRPRQ